MAEEVLDIVLVSVGMVALVAYHVFLFLRIRFEPMKTVVGVNHQNRRAWVHSIMKDVDKKNILAVQTLRNSIMASTLLASTAILLATGMAAFVSSTSTASLKASLNSMVLGSRSEAIVTAKFLAILICFLFGFVCHLQAIRYTNHVNFLINIPMGADAPGLTADYVANVLGRGSNFYTIGTRGFYFAFPLLLWLFGPIPMCVCSLLLVPLLHHLDSATDFRVLLENAKREDEEAGVDAECESEGLARGGRESCRGSEGLRSHAKVHHKNDKEKDVSPASYAE